MTATNSDTSPHYALPPAAKHSEEQECPTPRGMIRDKCPNCSGTHPAWSRLCSVANTQWTQAISAYSNRPREFTTNFQEYDDPFTGGRRNWRRPLPGRVSTDAHSYRTQRTPCLRECLRECIRHADEHSTLKLMIRVLYWNTRKRKQLIDIVLNFNLELDVIAISGS
ncbi:hypothetical protein E4U39_003200 [Claviceps sp. Clav50 group G5]|nr:hypothetical protein E4U39_003200 [Claviceps sp. Clav50 group G5]